MFSLIQGLWKNYADTPERKILLLGLDGAGKTTYFERLKFVYSGIAPLEASKICSTVGLNISRIRHKSVQYLIWDMGGSGSLRSLWDRYLTDADGLLWVIDAADLSRREELRKTMISILEREELQKKPLLIVVNKLDLGKTFEADDFIRSMDMELDGWTWRQRKCSAISGDGVKEGFDWLADVLVDD